MYANTSVCTQSLRGLNETCGTSTGGTVVQGHYQSTLPFYWNDQQQRQKHWVDQIGGNKDGWWGDVNSLITSIKRGIDENG
jgi:hypothetical protein